MPDDDPPAHQVDVDLDDVGRSVGGSGEHGVVARPVRHDLHHATI